MKEEKNLVCVIIYVWFEWRGRGVYVSKIIIGEVEHVQRFKWLLASNK